MPLVRELREEINEIDSLRFVTQAYTDISAARIKRIKEEFERNASFYQEIARVYQLTKTIALKKDNPSAAKGAKIDTNISIAITSNHRFYGRLNLDVLERFLRSEEAEKLVIGQTGREYFRVHGEPEGLEFFIPDHDRLSPEELHALLDRLKDYTKILVYYPKFESVFVQGVGLMDIAQAPTKTQLKVQNIDYIFEPELPKILKFFEEQIKYILFDRIMLETELSRVAARLWAMNEAQERAERALKSRKSRLRKVVRSLKNARLLNTFSAVFSSKA